MSSPAAIKARFEKATQIVGSLPKDGPVKPTQDDQLFFYGHYKQATVGKCTTPKPGMMDFTGKYKWNAWNNLSDLTSEQAMQAYVDHFIELLRSAPGEESEKYVKEIDDAGKAAETSA